MSPMMISPYSKQAELLYSHEEYHAAIKRAKRVCIAAGLSGIAVGILISYLIF